MDLLKLIDSYRDAAPRTGARAETIGPFTLFVGPEIGWRYYARPVPGASFFTPEAVRAVLARQRDLHMPESFEWIKETHPQLAAVMLDAGLRVRERPLMAQEHSGFVARASARPGGGGNRTPAVREGTVGKAPPLAVPEGVHLRLVTPDDDLALIGAVAYVAFSHPGTAAGTAGIAALQQAVLNSHPGTVQFERDRLKGGFTVMAAAFVDTLPVCTGSYQPVSDVAEVVAVGTLPAWRRRGIAPALTALLADHAKAHGARTIFLSAGDNEIARVYQRAGFRTIGTACDAGPERP